MFAPGAPTAEEIDMKHDSETIGDVGTPRWLVAVAAAVFVIAARWPATAASPGQCRQFHEECADARAAGYGDAGICHVERLECATDQDTRGRRPPHETRDDQRQDPERSSGERSVGP